MRIEILDQAGEVVSTIVATPEFAEDRFPGLWRLCAEQPDQAPQPSAPRHISVGAFYDRFGALKWDILADPNERVKAVREDASVRKYIDLDNPELPGGLAILQAAGHAIDPAAILDAPIQSHEVP